MNYREIIDNLYFLDEYEDPPCSLNEAFLLLNDFIRGLHSDKVETIKGIAYNVVLKTKEDFANAFFEAFDYEPLDLTVYDCHKALLTDFLGTIRTFSNYFLSIRGCLNDENYVELGKLAEFTYGSYIDSRSYLDQQMMVAEEASLGIHYHGTFEDPGEEFSEFFEEEFKRITGKEVGKVKQYKA